MRTGTARENEAKLPARAGWAYDCSRHEKGLGWHETREREIILIWEKRPTSDKEEASPYHVRDGVTDASRRYMLLHADVTLPQSPVCSDLIRCKKVAGQVEVNPHEKERESQGKIRAVQKTVPPVT